MTAEDLSAIAAALGPDAEVTEQFGRVLATVAAERWVAALTAARDGLGADFLDWLTGVDELEAGYLVAAFVASTEDRGPGKLGKAQGLIVRTRIAQGRAGRARRLDSATGVYRGAAWHERETFEMFGIEFTGHDGPQAAAAAGRLRGASAAQGLRARLAGRQGVAGREGAGRVRAHRRLARPPQDAAARRAGGRMAQAVHAAEARDRRGVRGRSARSRRRVRSCRARSWRRVRRVRRVRSVRRARSGGGRMSSLTWWLEVGLRIVVVFLVFMVVPLVVGQMEHKAMAHMQGRLGPARAGTDPRRRAAGARQRDPDGGRASYFLDVGANVDSRPEYLVQFAKMAAVYARDVMGRKAPRVGLLANGEGTPRATAWSGRRTCVSAVTVQASSSWGTSSLRNSSRAPQT